MEVISTARFLQRIVFGSRDFGLLALMLVCYPVYQRKHSLSTKLWYSCSTTQPIMWEQLILFKHLD